MQRYTYCWALVGIIVWWACRQSPAPPLVPAPDLIAPITTSIATPTPHYAWLARYDAAQTLAARIQPPAGYERVATESGSFAEWLRYLPLKAGKPDVLLWNGQPKHNQSAHAAVLQIDVGDKDLQQCADAVMRLRAEYLWSAKRYSDIQFRFTSGHNAPYTQWKQGYRPLISGNKVSWVKKAHPNSDYANFKQYLQQIFTYCGTSSLSKELHAVPNPTQIEAGDVWIRGGFPGHAVVVLDVAQDPNSGEKRFLLAQSYMPAQEIHLLNNPNNPAISPWYDTNFGNTLHTPEWDFDRQQLKRF